MNPLDQPTFVLHDEVLRLDLEGYLEDRIVFDATAPDGVRRQLTIRQWYVELISHNQGAWQHMGAIMLKHAQKLEDDKILEGARRDHAFLEYI